MTKTACAPVTSQTRGAQKQQNDASNYTESPVKELLNRLDDVRAIGNQRWRARCPSHDDNALPLDIREGKDGSALIHCFAGCTKQEVVDAIDMELGHLFPPREGRVRPGDESPEPADIIRRAVRELEGLNGGNPIPKEWIDCFSREAKPRKPRGRPRKSKRNLAIAIDFLRLCREREPRAEGKNFYEEGDDIKDWRRRVKEAEQNATTPFRKIDIAEELAEKYQLSGANKILEIVRDYEIEAWRSLIESGEIKCWP